MNYYGIPSLSNIYLEDSYVLSVREGEGSLIFELEAVLAENHLKYKKTTRRRDVLLQEDFVMLSKCGLFRMA